MKKILVLTILCFCFCFSINMQQAFAQKINVKDRLFVGGDIGGFFSGNYGQLQLSPIIGYYLTPKLSVGGGPTYEFYFFDRGQNVDNLKVNLFGGRAFTRFDVTSNIFAHGEFEYTRYSDNDDNKGNLSRLPIGGGYRQHLGGKSYFNIMALYDVLYTSNQDSDSYRFLRDSGYNGFIFRFGVNLGL